MGKRDASSQELDRSPERTQLIEILSDSDSELPTVGFSRLSALSQRARVSTQGKNAIARDSWLVKPDARRVDNGEEEEGADIRARSRAYTRPKRHWLTSDHRI
jgi:hypothetical protein